MDKVLKAFLKDIKNKPGTHIGICSFTNLSLYVSGYRAFAKMHDSVADNADFWIRFDYFIQKHYAATSGQDWTELILAYTSDEKDAFNAFFTFVDLYLESLGELTIDSAESFTVDWSIMDKCRGIEMPLQQLLNDIKENPKSYIVEPSLQRLHLFVNGYIMGGYLHNCPVIETDFWRGFDHFFEKKYSIPGRVSEYEMFDKASPSEEVDFYTFFDSLHSYLAQGDSSTT